MFNNLLLANLGEGLILANAADDIVKAVQSYVGPILLLIIGIMALTFLFKQQVMQFVIFLIIAIFVAVLFYAPGVVKSIAEQFTGEAGQGGNWGG